MINTIGIQEAWEAAGGNPGIKATKAELIEALNSLDEACDAIRDNAGQQGAVPLPRYGFTCGIQGGATLQPMNDGYWTPWHVADLVIAGLREERDARSPQPSKPASAVPIPGVRAYAEFCGTADPDVFDEKLWAWMNGLPLPEGENITLLCALGDAVLYGNAREAAAGGVPAITEAMIEMAARKVSAIAGENWGALGDFTRGVLMDIQRQAFAAAIPQQPTAEPVVEGVTHWEENASYLLDRCKHSIRVREGGGPENLLSSLIVTFMGMEQKLAIKAEPAVEATGTVDGYSWSGQTVEILMDGAVPRWMIGDKIRVTITPTGGKSDA